MSFIQLLQQAETKRKGVTSLRHNPLSSTIAELLTLEQLAQRIHREHQQCQGNISMSLVHGRNAGDDLLRAIALIEPEQWTRWLTDHCHLSEKTAITYMDIARGWPTLDRVSKGAPINPLPREKDNSEHPDLSLSDTKGERDRQDAVHSEAVLNPVDFTHSPEDLPEGDRSVGEQETSAPKETTTQSSPKIYSFWIPGKVTPKARPRVTKNGTFFPKRYREWRLKAQGEIIMQIQQMNPPPKLPMQAAALRILLFGNHRGDGDNAIGSVCDALVSAGVLPSDSLKYLPYGSWRHIKSEETGVKIEIKPL